MARCEDFPCCGHEPGCCPDFDESGRQLNMRCTCGAVLPINNRYSICDSCLREGDDECFDEDFDDDDDEFDRDVDDSMDGDHQSGLASAGFGDDEDYEHYLFDQFDHGGDEW
jgi:hypothetical protein